MAGVFVLSAPCPASWSPAFEDSMAARIPEPARRHVQMRRRQEDRIQSYVARLLLLDGLVKLFGFSDDCLTRWSVGMNGRPFLDGVAVDFNISHTAGMAVCAIAANGRVGIDVERPQRLKMEEVSFLFSEAERAAVLAAPDQAAELLRLWTMKEALLKADGCGFPNAPQALEEEKLKRRWSLTPLDIASGYFCHIASTPGVTATLRRMRLEQNGTISLMAQEC